MAEVFDNPQATIMMTHTIQHMSIMDGSTCLNNHPSTPPPLQLCTSIVIIINY